MNLEINQCVANSRRTSATNAGRHPHYSDRHLRALIDATPVAMLVIDRHGKIILANRQTEKTFGYKVDELLARDVAMLAPESARARHGQQVAEYFKTLTPRVMGVGREVYAVDRGGREFPVEIGLTPIDNGDGPQVVAAIIDITERKRIERESTLAKIVQEAMLPQSTPDFCGCDIGGFSQPADATGGDFFDYIALADHRLGVVIGDASGHGFAAALVTASARSYLRALSRVEPDLSQIMTTTNRLLIEDLRDGRFVTLFYAILNPVRSLLTCSGAGHASYVLGSTGALKQKLEGTGPPLGWFADAEYPAVTTTIARGDILLMLTDGIEEAMSPSGELFGRDRVINVVMQNSHEASAQIVRALHEAVHEFRSEHKQHDDATVIVVKFDP